MHSELKIAILGEDKPGFIQPMSEGLAKMLDQLGATSQVFPEGLALLNYNRATTTKTNAKKLIKKLVNRIKPQHYLIQQSVRFSQVQAFEAQLQSFDLIVVVCHIPTAFMANELVRIEQIRKTTNIPIILYQNYYLATRGDWYHKITNPGTSGESKKNAGYGLERFDWYLAASMVSEYPLSGKEHPCSIIGHDLRDGSLFANPDKSFKVLLDFERKGFEQYRQLQIQALKETDTPYTQLCARYTRAQIRALYCEHSALFLSFRESFGLPIVENQLCGNYIFTPFRSWTPSHYINKSLYEAGEGALGSNFMVYDNNLQTLKAQIIACRDSYRPLRLVEQFKLDYPQLFHGDLEALQALLKQVSAGQITGDSHKKYLHLNADIVRQ